MLRAMLIAAMALTASTGRGAGRDYAEVVGRVAEMTWDYKSCELASRYGMDVVNVTWEDTGRYSGSCWGPNISDMTIQVHHEDPTTGQKQLTCMPVIRYPNFHDLSADLDPDDFFLLAGNERGEDLAPVTLRDYVDHLRNYLHDPDCWKADGDGLLCERDSLVLVSAQAVFLPIQTSGTATFNPVLFNYQSYEGDPAVLTILATREGTSVTVIDNTRDPVPGAYSWGQRLFFNEDGQRASLTGERISDFMANGGDDGQQVSAAGEEGLNMVLLIQIPLRQRNPQSTWFDDVVCCESAAAPLGAAQSRDSDVEAAVIGHGELEGPFTEIDDLPIERDPNFPIRVTVQFYKATETGEVTEDDIREIHSQIERVYDDAEYVGSLVIPDPGRDRPTDWDRDAVPRRLNRYWDAWRRHLLGKLGRLDLVDDDSNLKRRG
ncbi:MAG: hypothetical protein R6U36_03945 [Candidatus Fermentibacteraceae bacterium]